VSAAQPSVDGDDNRPGLRTAGEKVAQKETKQTKVAGRKVEAKKQKWRSVLGHPALTTNGNTDEHNPDLISRYDNRPGLRVLLGN